MDVLCEEHDAPCEEDDAPCGEDDVPCEEEDVRCGEEDIACGVPSGEGRFTYSVIHAYLHSGSYPAGFTSLHYESELSFSLPKTVNCIMLAALLKPVRKQYSDDRCQPSKDLRTSEELARAPLVKKTAHHQAMVNKCPQIRPDALKGCQCH